MTLLLKRFTCMYEYLVYDWSQYLLIESREISRKLCGLLRSYVWSLQNLLPNFLNYATSVIKSKTNKSIISIRRIYVNTQLHDSLESILLSFVFRNHAVKLLIHPSCLYKFSETRRSCIPGCIKEGEASKYLILGIALLHDLTLIYCSLNTDRVWHWANCVKVRLRPWFHRETCQLKLNICEFLVTFCIPLNLVRCPISVFFFISSPIRSIFK